jgi:hypothetical protein
MSTKPIKPLPGPKPNMNTNVSVSMKDTEPVKCEDCNNTVFIPAFFMRRLSPLMSPTGEEAMIPVQVYSCGNCGKVPKTFQQEVDDES